jgi:hypothetical protein
MTEYYVTVGDDVVEGPFETRKEAKRRKDELSTNEIGVRYRVSARS